MEPLNFGVGRLFEVVVDGMVVKSGINHEAMRKIVRHLKKQIGYTDAINWYHRQFHADGHTVRWYTV